MGETTVNGPPVLHPALIRHTGFLISRMGMVAQKRFAELIDSIGLTPRMWGAMNVLEAEGAITQHALCQCTGMDPSSMVSTIDELESMGLAERRRHPTDRRAHALHLTDAGRETLQRGRELARRAQEDLLAPLTAPERAQLHSLLLRLAMASREEVAGGGGGGGGGGGKATDREARETFPRALASDDGRDVAGP